MDYIVVTDTGIKGVGTYTFEGYSQDQAKDWIIRHHAAPSQQPDQFNNLQACFNGQQTIDNIGKLTGLFMQPGNTTQLPEMSLGEQALILPPYHANGVFGTPGFCNSPYGGGFGGGFSPHPPPPQEPDIRLITRTA